MPLQAKMFQAGVASAVFAFLVLPAGAASRWAIETDPHLSFRYSYPVSYTHLTLPTTPYV